VVGAGRAGVGGRGQVRGGRRGRGGVDGDAEAGRGGAGVAGDVRLLGGQGVDPVGQIGRASCRVRVRVGEGRGAHSRGGGGVEGGQRACFGADSRECGSGVVGSVVGAGRAGVGGRGQVRGGRRGRGGVDGDAEAGRSHAGVAGDVRLLGGQGVDPVG